MKKSIFCLFGTLCFSALLSQTGTNYEIDFTDPDNDYLYGATAFGVSANGEWVTGYGDEFTMSSFVWNRTTGEYQCITGAPYSTDTRDRSECYAVSNDGIVVGGVETKKGYLSPGYWKDGVWEVLEGGEGESAMATSISPNGRFMAGHVLKTVQKTYYDFDYDKNEYDYEHPHKKDAKVYVPVTWVDGKLQETSLPSWYPDPDKVGTGIYCFHASADGKNLALNYEHPSGSKAPAALINGQLKFFYGAEDIDVNTDTYFFFGETTNVSLNGKFFCGYFAVDGVSAVGFVYDVENDSLTELNVLPACVRNDGTYYTADPSLGQGVMGVSADGLTFCGYKTEQSDLGTVPYPVVFVSDGFPDDLNATFEIASVSPAEGTTVDVLKDFVLSFDKVADYGLEIRPYLIDSEGKRVAYGNFSFGDADMSLQVLFSEPIYEKGSYTLVIPTCAVGDAAWSANFCQMGLGSYNEELRVEYQISGRYSLSPVSTDPEEGSSLDREGNNVFHLTFDTEVKVDASKKPALKLSAYGDGLQGTIEVDADDAKVVSIVIPEALSANKSYSLYVPAGAISTTDDAWLNLPLSISYVTDAVAPEYDITLSILTPHRGTVAAGESLETLLLETSREWYDKKGTASDAKFYRHDTTEEVTAVKKLTYTTADYYQVKVVLEEAVSEEGTYDLFIPEGLLGDQDFVMGTGGHANKEQLLVFVIGSGTSDIAALSEEMKGQDVYDVTGKLIIHHATVADLNQLPNGIYTIGHRRVCVAGR